MTKHQETSTPAEFERFLAQNVKPGRFILSGNSDYLKDEFLHTLTLKLLNPELKPFNYDEFDGDELDDVERLIFATLMLPNFSEFRLVVLRNPEKMRGSDIVKLARIKVPTTTIFVIITMEKNEKLKEFGEFLEQFDIIRLDNPSESVLPAWIEYFFSRGGKKVSKEALKFLSSSLPCELYTVKNEIEKIVLYLGHKEICELDDAEKVFASGRERTIYQYLRALRAKNENELSTYSYELQMLNEGGVKFLYVVANELIKLLFTKLSESSRTSHDELAKTIGVSNEVLYYLAKDAKNFTLNELRELIDHLYSLELSFKRGELKDELIPAIFTAKVLCG